MIFPAAIGLGLILGGCARRGLVAPEVPTGVRIYRDGADAALSLRAMSGALDPYDVIFIGEIHDDSLTHVMEREILEILYGRDEDLALALEMFERDVQPVLDAYLAGEVSEEVFLEKSRPWGNYSEAYRPLVEFARINRLPVLAMNVPRRYANRVAMGGEKVMAAVPDSERVFLARKLKVLEGRYRDRFMETMTGMKGPMGRMNPENLYAAQCLKDDTMAESIQRFLEENPDTRVVSYQGDFHSAFGLGIPGKLRGLRPGVRIAVITIVPLEDTASAVPGEYAGQGNFLIFVKRISQK
jgi:uncharacterized iron-regulated protein